MSLTDKAGAGVRLRADLHTHSVYSDGFYTPDELCRRAKRNGVQILSVTDHDTMNGEAEKRAAARKYGLFYVSGWEISAYLGECKVHVAGYGCRENEAYLSFMRERKELGFARAEDCIRKLRALGIFVTLEEAKARRADSDSPLHTMHIAAAAAAASGKTPGEIYEEYLAPGRPAHSSIGRPTPEQAIHCIHDSGGLASIAHPGRIALPFDEREALLCRLAACGADGIEAVYTTHTERETEYFRAMAERLGLFVTGGSDTHVEDERHAIGLPLFYPSGELLRAIRPDGWKPDPCPSRT